MRILLLSIFSLMLFATYAQESTIDWEYWKTEIISMKNADQELRKAYGRALKANEPSEIVRSHMSELDSLHNIKLHKYVDSAGVFPMIEQIGEEGAHAFWLLTMHQDSDMALQELVLTWMKDLRKTPPFLKRDLAFLDDRVAVNRGRCQAYGTQFDRLEDSINYEAFPICDMKKLKNLRRKMKLMSFDQQFKIENQ